MNAKYCPCFAVKDLIVTAARFYATAPEKRQHFPDLHKTSRKPASKIARCVLSESERTRATFGPMAAMLPNRKDAMAMEMTVRGKPGSHNLGPAWSPDGSQIAIREAKPLFDDHSGALAGSRRTRNL